MMNSVSTRFAREVSLRYQLYNGLFLTLPFPSLETVGIRLPLFAEYCREALSQGDSASQIVENFFGDMLPGAPFDKILSTLFLLTQLMERQIVLFDALEEAAFPETRGLESRGSIQACLARLSDQHRKEKLPPVLKDYRTRVVLTAHPTQFYPESVLGIIEDLAGALRQDDLSSIELLLLQLGKTSFKNANAPTPLTEADSLLHRAHKAFYESMLEIEVQLDEALGSQRPNSAVIELGFWPGGDRDGNPFVNAETTLRVAASLRHCILSHYREELKQLRKRLTFPGMSQVLDKIEDKLEMYSSPEELLDDIRDLCDSLVLSHQSLYLDQAKRFYSAVRTFGFHFASLDLRQDSSAHEEIVGLILRNLKEIDYASLATTDKASLLSDLCSKDLGGICAPEHPLAEDTFASLSAVNDIQQSNGPRGMHRYIISNTQSAAHVLELIFLSRCVGYVDIPFDIVPLFETIDDLHRAPEIMKALYEAPLYREHLEGREQRQTVMLGYSDGTKDGGYLSCNWEIFLAKQRLEALSKEYGLEIVFFDGRGGPPARGGGNTHRFYRALGASLKQTEVQLTIQGQTISSNFGSQVSAGHNLEQLFTSGLEGKLFAGDVEPLHPDDIALLSELSSQSLAAYKELREHPQFLPFLEEMTPLQEFGNLKIASRPTRRRNDRKLRLGDLRAIPFVGAWSQMKLNVPGFYGLGIALKWAIGRGMKQRVQDLYAHNPFFSTLIDNAMQALAKSDARYTQHLLQHPVFGDFVTMIHEELCQTRLLILEICQQNALLERDPVNQQSILLREQLIMPLVIIQHYAMSKVKESTDPTQRRTFEKLLRKTIPAITNASRNSA